MRASRRPISVIVVLKEQSRIIVAWFSARVAKDGKGCSWIHRTLLLWEATLVSLTPQCPLDFLFANFPTVVIPLDPFVSYILYYPFFLLP